jgi:hypothetical protein
MSWLQIEAGTRSWRLTMYSGYQCANCGSIRTNGFYGDHFLVCIRCDDCSHVEYRDDRDIDDEDLVAV